MLIMTFAFSSLMHLISIKLNLSNKVVFIVTAVLEDIANSVIQILDNSCVIQDWTYTSGYGKAVGDILGF